MANVTAKIKLNGKNFEILVDCDKALAFKKGKGIIDDVLITENIFSDLKRGLNVKEKDIEACFKTKDIKKAAEKIVREGEIQTPSEYKSKEREEKIKQIIDFISRSCTDPKGIPHTPDRIRDAIKEAKVTIEDKRGVEEQISHIIRELQKVLPLKFETKKLRVEVPAIYSGKVYGILTGHIIKEDWLSDGSLSCIISIPSSSQMSFFDKLNGITHGSAITEEVKD